MQDYSVLWVTSAILCNLSLSKQCDDLRDLSREAKIFTLIPWQLLKAYKSARMDFGIETMVSLKIKIVVLKKNIKLIWSGSCRTPVGAQMTEGALM